MDYSPKYLKRVVVFQNATDDDLQFILQNSLTRSIEEDDYLFPQGGLANNLIVEGPDNPEVFNGTPCYR